MSFVNKVLLLLPLLLNISVEKCVGVSPTENKLYNIFVIHSYDSIYPAYPDINKQIEKSFIREKIKANFTYFYLDCERYQSQEELKRMYNYIDKIQKKKPDLILLNDDQATYSTLACHHPFLKTVPIIFSGVNFPNWEVLQDYSNVTGFWDKPNYVENVEMIERIFGKTNVLFFHDGTFLGQQVIKEMEIQFINKSKVFANTEVFKLLANDSIVIEKKYIPYFQLEKSRMSTPDITTFYYINPREDKGKNLLWSLSGMIRKSAFVQTKYDFITMRLGQLAAIPSFSVINEGVGYNNGILGGYFTTPEIQAEEQVAYAARIFKGESIKELPITQSRKKYVLDWNELQRWDIPLSSLPNNYEIINMPFKVKHSTIFILLIIGSVLLPLFIGALFIMKKKKKSSLSIVPTDKEKVLSIKSENYPTSPVPEIIKKPVTIQTCIKEDSPIILIAEDNEANYLLLKSILNKKYTLIWVQNGKDAVKCVNEQNIDLVLMDIKMPEMDGIEALQEIRKTHHDLPVIMQTAHAFEADRIKAQQAGCSDFLTKPISASDLHQAIHQLIS